MNTHDDLAAIARQETELVFETFDETTAWNLGSRLRSLAIERGHGLAIDVRRFGQQLFFCALPGAVPDQAEWIRRKVNVVARFHRSSYAIGRELARSNSSLEEKQGLPTIDYATHGGCFPIRVKGAGIIGCITVSGLPQRDDHELVVEAICLELGKNDQEFRLSAPVAQ
ncbi:MAG: heme-degrading domain-containing protein [Acidobacteriaceae bacterium]